MGILSTSIEFGRLGGAVLLIGQGGRIANAHSNLSPESLSYADGADALTGILYILCGFAVLASPVKK